VLLKTASKDEKGGQESATIANAAATCTRYLHTGVAAFETVPDSV
jgi:hypothetical protein